MINPIYNTIILLDHRPSLCEWMKHSDNNYYPHYVNWKKKILPALKKTEPFHCDRLLSCTTATTTFLSLTTDVKNRLTKDWMKNFTSENLTVSLMHCRDKGPDYKMHAKYNKL